MAGGTITRTAFGVSTDVVDNDFTGHYNKLSMNAGGHHAFKANVTNYGNPKDLPPAGKYFIKGWWTDENNQEIKETTIGEKVRFHLRTQNIPDGDKVIFYVYEWDGLKIFSDKLDLVKSGTSQISNEIEIKLNTGYIEWITGEGALSFFNENLEGNEIELFVECTYKEEQLDLPLEESNYLILYEKEVLITVIVELPHSKETGWGAKGLAGHSAMAIGERYFDYGPNNSPGTYSEQDYDVDFNDDGDRVDNVNLSNPSFKNAPGMPWWGTHIAIKNNITPEQVTLQMVYQYLSIPWNDTVDVNGNIVQYGTNIYGKVHKIEFYVKESEAKKMIKWWEERYKHLKIYSVFPWTGEQCTTTVKTAIQQAFPLEYFGDNKNYISDETQKPSGLLNDLQKFLSTSKQHLDKKSVVTIIKQEASNWVP